MTVTSDLTALSAALRSVVDYEIHALPKALTSLGEEAFESFRILVNRLQHSQDQVSEMKAKLLKSHSQPIQPEEYMHDQ